MFNFRYSFFYQFISLQFPAPKLSVEDFNENLILLITTIRLFSLLSTTPYVFQHPRIILLIDDSTHPAVISAASKQLAQGNTFKIAHGLPRSTRQSRCLRMWINSDIHKWNQSIFGGRSFCQIRKWIWLHMFKSTWNIPHEYILFPFNFYCQYQNYTYRSTMVNRWMGWLLLLWNGHFYRHSVE